MLTEALPEWWFTRAAVVLPTRMEVGTGLMSAVIVGTFAGMLVMVAVPDPPVVPLQLVKVFQLLLVLPFQVAARAFSAP